MKPDIMYLIAMRTSNGFQVSSMVLCDTEEKLKKAHFFMKRRYKDPTIYKFKLDTGRYKVLTTAEFSEIFGEDS